jgi:hypothetical protein
LESCRREEEKKMKRNFCACSIVGGALLSAGAVLAQEAAPPLPPPPMMMLQEGMPEEGGPPGAIGERIELLGFEGMHPGKVVKSAPFSATATSETTQMLQDGTVIHRKTTSTLYRDSQGRSRREVTFSGFGPLQTTGKPHTMVMINDPIAGAHYMLNAEEKVAHKMSLRLRDGGDSPEKAAALEEKMHQHMAIHEAAGELTKESLGAQSINGVSAEGTRITHTIPAGRIGNDRPIDIVFERWYSPDLQMVVKSTRTDPRFGTATYTMTNIQRAEPAAALFTVPSDYTVKERGPGNRRFHGGPPPGAPSDAPAPPPAN